MGRNLLPSLAPPVSRPSVSAPFLLAKHMGSSPSSYTRHAHCSPLDLLPDTALSLASSLPSDEHEVLSYLLGLALRTHDTSAATFPSGSRKSVWKPWKSYAFGAGKLGSAAFERSVFHPHLTAGVHPPTFGCDCFDCYAKFWGRWDASPHRDVIERILELVDRQLEDGPSPGNLMGAEGKEETDEMKAVERALLRKQESAGRGRKKLSWKKNGRGERIKPGKIKLPTVPGGRISEVSLAPMDPKSGPAEEVDEQKLSNCFPPDRVLTQNVVSEAVFDAHPSPNGSQAKNCSKQRGGKRKSKQVAPLDGDSVQAEVQTMEEDVIGSEGPTAGEGSVAVRTENASFRGRGFLGRVFPDAMGGVATRLWDFVSLRLRSHSTDFY